MKITSVKPVDEKMVLFSDGSEFVVFTSADGRPHVLEVKHGYRRSVASILEHNVLVALAQYEAQSNQS